MEPYLGGRVAVEDLHQLYEDHVAFVRRAVVRLGGPTADVEDLVHDVFLVAFDARHRFEGRSQLSTWLYGIAIRVVSQARRRGRLRELFGLSTTTEPIEHETPHRAFEHQEASALVYRALDKIGERKRTVFILFELEGLSGEEIAQIVDCPLKTVWTRLFHARKEFEAHLARATRSRVPDAAERSET